MSEKEYFVAKNYSNEGDVKKWGFYAPLPEKFKINIEDFIMADKGKRNFDSFEYQIFDDSVLTTYTRVKDAETNAKRWKRRFIDNGWESE